MRTRRWRAVPVVAVVVLLTVLPPAAAQRAAPVRLGAIIPLSGPEGVSGQAMQKGYQLALEEVNARGGVLGRPLELIVEDDKGDPPTGAAVFQKLVTRDRIDILIGGLQSSVTIAVVSQVLRQPILMAWTGAAFSGIERDLVKDADWFFHYHPWDYHNTDSLFRFIQAIGAKTVAVAHEDGPFGAGSIDAIRAFARNYGVEVTFIDAFKSGTPDLTPLLTKAKAANADVFVFISFAQDVVPIVTQARQVGFAPKLMIGTPPSWPIGYERLAAGNNVAGLALWTPENRHPASRRFVSRWREKFREEPTSYWGPLAYTNVVTVADAVNRAGSTDRAAVTRALAATDYEGPIGRRLTFKRSLVGRYQGFTSLIAFQWRDGKQVTVWPEELAGARLQYPAGYGR